MGSAIVCDMEPRDFPIGHVATRTHEVNRSSTEERIERTGGTSYVVSIGAAGEEPRTVGTYRSVREAYAQSTDYLDRPLGHRCVGYCSGWTYTAVTQPD